jgi:hypothetical protein
VGDRGFETQRLAWQDDQFARIALPGGALCVTRGLGSGLARCRSDAPDLFWAIGTGGPI